MRLQTYVAPLLSSIAGHRLAKAPSPANKEKPEGIFWLDELLEGGLYRPSELKHNPLVVLIYGPPGAGKSILAQQICYNRARKFARTSRTADGVSKKSRRDAMSLYVTTEATPGAIIANMNALDMTEPRPKSPQIFSAVTRMTRSPETMKSGSELIEPTPTLEDTFEYSLPSEAATNPPPMLIVDVPQLQGSFDDCLVNVQQQIYRDIAPFTVVIDSLNVFAPRSASGLLEKVKDSFHGWVHFLIVIVDSGHSDLLKEEAYRAFRADVLISMNYQHGPSEYFLRSIEIVKARYQPHVLGRHVVKILRPVKHHWAAVYGNSEHILAIARSKDEVRQKAEYEAQRKNINRETLKYLKYRETDPEGVRPHALRGGIFVFPSPHYILSRIRSEQQIVLTNPVLRLHPPGSLAVPPSHSKKLAPWGPGAGNIGDGGISLQHGLRWPLPYCFELVGTGIPAFKCTALVGRRGARKSVFAYQFLMDGLSNGERTLLISFRDDFGATHATLSHIARAKQYRNVFEPNRDNLKLIYQRPGFVTPEELLHRVLTAIAEFGPTRAVINAVDQWDCSYPLLSASEVLVAALIEMLNAHKVTSMVVGVTDSAGNGGNKGLTARAEVVLSFENRRILTPKFGTRRSKGSVEDGFLPGVRIHEPPKRSRKNVNASDRPEVVVRAVRVPRGGAGSGRALLRYKGLTDGTPAALTMLPLAPEYPEGDLIEA